MRGGIFGASFRVSEGLWGTVRLPATRDGCCPQMLGVEGLTQVPLDNRLKTLDAVLPLIGAPEQASALGPGPWARGLFQAEPWLQDKDRDKWD